MARALDTIGGMIRGGKSVIAARKRDDDFAKGVNGTTSRQESNPNSSGVGSSSGLSASQEAKRKAKAKKRAAQVKRGPSAAEIAAIRARRNK